MNSGWRSHGRCWPVNGGAHRQTWHKIPVPTGWRAEQAIGTSMLRNRSWLAGTLARQLAWPEPQAMMVPADTIRGRPASALTPARVERRSTRGQRATAGGWSLPESFTVARTACAPTLAGERLLRMLNRSAGRQLNRSDHAYRGFHARQAATERLRRLLARTTR
jgi:hypothetical protein